MQLSLRQESISHAWSRHRANGEARISVSIKQKCKQEILVSCKVDGQNAISSEFQPDKHWDDS